MSGLYRSSNGSDFHLEIRAFPVVGFLVIELGLQADEEVAGEAEAELGTEGEVGADCLFLTRSTYELKRDYRAEGLCFFSLRFAEEVMVLEAHPVFRFVSEIASELQAVLRGEQAAAGENVIEQLRADVEVSGELRLGQAVIVQEIPQHGGGGVCEGDGGDFWFHGFTGSR